MIDREPTLLGDLRQNEEWFRILFEQAADIIFLLEIGPDGLPVIRDANNATFRILGYERDELIGRPISFIEAEAPALVSERRQKILPGKEIIFEARHRCKDGSIRQFECSVTEMQIGSKLFAVSIERDVTERKQTEESLKERERRLQKIFDLLPVGLWFTDKEGRLLQGNPEGVRIWGAEPKVNPKEYGVFTARRLPSGKELAPDDWALAHSIRDKVTIRDELLEIDAFDGQKRIVLNYTAPVLDDDGTLLSAIVVNKDITDRYHADNALRESEERYRLIAENTADSVTVLDLSLKFVYVSPSTKRMRGFSIEEVMAQTIEQAMTPASLQIANQAFEEEMALEQSGTADPTRSRILILEEYCKDGSTLWVENTLSFIRDEKGTPKAILSVSRDITDRRKAEAALRESEFRFNQLAEQSRIIAWEVDARGLYTYVSHVAETILGYTAAELVGRKHFYDLHPEEGREIFKVAAFAAFERKETFENLINPMQAKDGHQVWFSTNGIPLLNANGTLRGYRGSDTDITDRKKLEQALQESEQYLRSTIDGLSANIAVLDEDGTILLVNKAWRNFAEKNGIPAEKVSEGANYLQICDTADGDHSQEAAPFAQGIRDVLAGKSENFSMEYPCNSPRKQRWFIGYVTLFPGEGPRRVVVAHENNTERKLLALDREELIKALQDKNDEMEGMLYASSHDLRTPLVSIQGFNSLIQHAIKDLTTLMDKDRPIEDICAEARPIITEKMTVATKYIAQSAEKMNGLVDGILKLSRLGRATHTPETVNMNAVVRESLATLDFQIKQAQATVMVGDLPSCWGDRNELGQAFTNLIDNAVKYRDPARPLTIAVTGTAFHNRVSYSIEDNGIGMKKDHQPQIWGLFARLEPNGPVAGEGLGLAMVKRIVQRNHGKVWVESEKGAGSKFYLSLPSEHNENGQNTKKE